MGLFGFTCSKCGEHKDQYDFTEECVVSIEVCGRYELVFGKYNGYGAVEIRLKDGGSLLVHDIQFEDSFGEKVTHVSYGIWCYGKTDCYDLEEERYCNTWTLSSVNLKDLKRYRHYSDLE